jgi:hypothetical protein
MHLFYTFLKKLVYKLWKGWLIESMTNNLLTEAETEIKNNEYRAFMIARLQAVRDAETAQRKASGKAHLEREEAARKLGGSRDWSKQ